MSEQETTPPQEQQPQQEQPSSNSNTEEPKQDVPVDENGKPLSKKALKKLEKQRKKEAAKKAREAEEAAKQAALLEEFKDTFGFLPVNQSQSRENKVFSKCSELTKDRAGEGVLVRARVHQTRTAGGKMTFLIIRDRFTKVQCLVDANREDIPRELAKFTSKLKTEALIDVYGTLEEAEQSEAFEVELIVSKLFVVVDVVADEYPLSVEDASRSEQDVLDAEKEGKVLVTVGQDTRLNNRWLDMRTNANQAIFRLQAATQKIFRDTLTEMGFCEVHTPKIINIASEGGAEVFSVNYFETDAYLAQSPQLFKQMCICSDMDRVFEIGPVFRAENAHTHRHLTEFVGMDLEMSFNEHYHEVLDVMNTLFLAMFNGLINDYGDLINVVANQYPCELIKYNEEQTLIIDYPEAVQMIREDGFLNQDGTEQQDLEDFETPTERRLGELVKEKYGVDFYCVDKFPSQVRPFYTMPDAENPDYSNSYDFMLRGQEIMSGAQRVHDADLLVERAIAKEVEPETVKEYIESFRYATPMHGGGGIGLERFLMLFLGLNNIRKTSLFPRDPKRLAP